MVEIYWEQIWRINFQTQPRFLFSIHVLAEVFVVTLPWQSFKRKTGHLMLDFWNVVHEVCAHWVNNILRIHWVQIGQYNPTNTGSGFWWIPITLTSACLKSGIWVYSATFYTLYYLNVYPCTSEIRTTFWLVCDTCTLVPHWNAIKFVLDADWVFEQLPLL